MPRIESPSPRERHSRNRLPRRWHGWWDTFLTTAAPSHRNPRSKPIPIANSRASRLRWPVIDSQVAGAIVDIGAGHGILLARLVALDAFAIGQAWQYIAVEDGALHDDILSIATRHRVHKRVDVIDLASFYGPWRRPHVDAIVMVCRNVLHELSIDATAALFEKLAVTCQVGDIVVVRDLAVFPRAEKGNACWRRPDLEHVVRPPIHVDICR